MENEEAKEDFYEISHPKHTDTAVDVGEGTSYTVDEIITSDTSWVASLEI